MTHRPRWYSVPTERNEGLEAYRRWSSNISVPWRETSARLRVVTVAAVLAWCSGMASLLTVGYIENVALDQPSVGGPVYRHPQHVKGVVRFLTDEQERVYSIAAPIMYGSFVSGVFLVFLANRLRDKAKQSRLKPLR